MICTGSVRLCMMMSSHMRATARQSHNGVNPKKSFSKNGAHDLWYSRNNRGPPSEPLQMTCIASGLSVLSPAVCYAMCTCFVTHLLHCRYRCQPEKPWLRGMSRRPVCVSDGSLSGAQPDGPSGSSGYPLARHGHAHAYPSWISIEQKLRLWGDALDYTYRVAWN